MSRRRSSVRRRRNPGAGAVLGVVAVTGGIAALVALAYRRQKQEDSGFFGQRAFDTGKQTGDCTDFGGSALMARCQEGARLRAAGAGRYSINGRSIVREAGESDASWQARKAALWAEVDAADAARGPVEVYGVNDRSIVREAGESDASWEARKEALQVEVLGPEDAARRRREPVNEGVLAPNVKPLSGGVLGPALEPLDFLAGGGAIYLSVLRHKKLRFWPVVGALFFPWIALPYQGAMVAIKK